MFRVLFRKFLLGRGYTRHQVKAIFKRLDWGKVKEVIRLYGPTLLKIFLALLPLILEKPATLQQTLPADEEEDYNINFDTGWSEFTEYDFVGSPIRGLAILNEPASLAMKFHEAYERLAPSFGYETRTETRQFDPQSTNGKLMIAVCEEILNGPPPGTCTLPPEDYYCSKDAGHTGPCPTYRRQT